MTVAQMGADDCLQAATATLLGLERDAIPDGSKVTWDAFVRQVADRTGIELWSVRLTGEKPTGRWIALVKVVRARGRGLHAVVMNGDRLEWDPEQRDPIVGNPDDIELCILAVPLDPRNGGSR